MMVLKEPLVDNFAGAFRVRTHINRLRQGVAEVGLQTMTEGMTQRDLAGIVITHADRSPGIERGKLRLPEF